MHSDLVKWIVKLLLSITEKDSVVGLEGEGQEEAERRHLDQIQAAANLKSDYTMLARSITDFTTLLSK